MPLSPGASLGVYTITGHLGKGGMGEVYRARDSKLDREVAIKVLPEAFAADTERIARFEREARTLASLNDPHIAHIYGIEESGGIKALVLELVEGPTLAERIVQGAIPLDEAMPIATQIAAALETAHEQGIVHRDLKPANVKLRADGTVKVLDFGLAKALDPAASSADQAHSPTITAAAMTHAGVILGTAAYMSPEQAKGKIVDKRADIWAFGCVLYEMLTGRLAFSGETVSETLADVMKSTPSWDTFPSAVPPGIRSLVQRCLRKDPRQRIRDIGDVRLELERLQTEPDDAMAAARRTPSAWLSFRWVIPGAIAVMIAGAVAGWALRPMPAPEARPISRFSYVLPEDQGFRSMGRPVVAFSPDGRGFVYNTAQGLFYRALDELDARIIAGTEGTLVEPVFSPDGQWIAYFGFGELRKIAVSGGAPVTLCPASIPNGIGWDADDSIVFGQPAGIMRVPAAGGKPDLVVEAKPGESVDGPHLLPGGRAVIFASTRTTASNRWDVAEVLAQDLQTGARTVLLRGGSAPRYVPTGHLLYMTGSTLFAVPFDVDRLAVTGGPVAILQGVQRAALTGGANYQFSDGGTLVYLVNNDLTSQRARTLGFVDRAGTATAINVAPAAYVSPRLSPDGRRLAVETSSDAANVIWIFDLSATSAIRRLTQGNTASRPVWTPDGTRITFGGEQGGKAGIFWQLADGSAPAERLTTAEAGILEYPESWSPDGRVLSFARIRSENQAAGWSVWTLSREANAKPVLLADSPESNEFGSAFSPDGKWIAYSTTGEGFKIYVQPFPATGARYEVATGGAVWPLWSRDGRELLYRPSTAQAGVPTINVVRVATQPAFSFSNQQTLPIRNFLIFQNYRDFDITPDGKRLVVVRPVQQTAAPDRITLQVNVVQNWFEELKQRVQGR
jgi:serine/threonine-protein kinase